MTAMPAGLPAAPVALAEGWRVEIPMPLFTEGRNRGKPVGWLNLNDVGGGVRAAMLRDRQKKEWRLAAKLAYQAHRLPRGLDRIYVTVEFRFPDKLHRDPSNYELTVKPCIDALQPQKEGIRYNPGLKRRAPFVEHGWGVVAGDDPRFVVRGPEMAIGEPLGRKNLIKGMVIIHIKPLPALETRP